MSSPKPDPRPLPNEPQLPASFWWMSMMAMVVPTGVLVLTMCFQSLLHLGPWVWVMHSALIGLGIAVIGVIYRRDKISVKLQIARHASLLCPRCRYPLDALPPTAATDRCPECGTANEPEKIRAIWRAWEESLDRKTRRAARPD